MTLNTTESKIAYAGDGTTAAFAIPFKFLDNGDVEAILRVDTTGAESVWVENTQYSLSGVGNDAGGTLTVSTNPTNYIPQSEETLVIRRVANEVQGSAFPAGGAFPSITIETALDRLTMLVQQHTEAISRALLAPTTDPGSSIDKLPSSVVRASKYLGFDGDGAPIALDAPVGTSPVSSFMADVLLAATGSAVRALLDAMEDVFTTRGDLAYRGPTAAQRMALGVNGQVLQSNGTDPVWATLPHLLGRDKFCSANTTLTAADDGKVIRCDAGAGNITITLPASPSSGLRYAFMRTDTSSNKVTIDGNGKTISSLSAVDLLGQGDYVVIATEGTTWQSLSQRRTFTSAQQTITTAGSVTLSHGLGVRPRRVQLELVCTDAGGEAGYTQNERVIVNLNSHDGSGRGVAIKTDSANLTVRFANIVGVFAIDHATTGNFTTLTNSKWTLVVTGEA